MIDKQIEKVYNQKKQGYEVAKIMDFGYLKHFIQLKLEKSLFELTFFNCLAYRKGFLLMDNLVIY